MEADCQGKNPLASEHSLFSKLPTHIVEKILATILDNPPFLTLYNLCRVCRKWRGIILSIRLSTYYLAYLHLSELHVFHSKSGLWEVLSLQFCKDQLPEMNFEHLQICSSSWGLLLLSSHTYDHYDDGYYFVCNPLTRSCIRLEDAPGFDIFDSRLGEGMSMAATYLVWAKVLRSTSTHLVCSSLLQNLRVYHIEISRQFELVVHYNPGNRPRIGVQELWEQKYCTVPDNFTFLIGAHIVQSRDCVNLGCVNLGFSTAARGFRILYYDLVEERFKWVRAKSDPRLRYNVRRQLFGTVLGEHRYHLEFAEVSFSGREPKISNPRSLNSVCRHFMRTVSSELLGPTALDTALLERQVHMTILYVGLRDVLYYVAILRVSRLTGRPPSFISVWTHNQSESLDLISDWVHNRVGSSDLISKWKAWIHWTDAVLPVGPQFYVFQPSFESPSNIEEVFH